MGGRRRTPVGLLFALLTLGFAGLAVWAGIDRQWIILVAALALTGWMGELAYRVFRS